MNRFFLILLALSFVVSNSFALDDSLQKSIEIASQGNDIQSERLKIVAENIANEYSTSDKPGGDPYRRKTLIVENKYNKKKRTNLLGVKKYSEDKSAYEIRYDPNHPAADAKGYVKFPNVSRMVEMGDASEAQRSYEANLGVIELSRSMINKTLDVIR